MKKLLDAYGKEVPSTRPVMREIGVGGIRNEYSSYPSQGLTPERLGAILKEADQGNIHRQSELFEEMEEKDAHLASVLQTRKLAVAGLKWKVTPASEGPRDRDAAAFIGQAIASMKNWDDALINLLDAIGKGFSVCEIMWDISGGRVWAGELRWRHQKKFTFCAPHASGTAVTQWPRIITDAAPVHGEELPLDKFVVHLSRGRSVLTPRAGVLRPCAWMYLFKNYTLKDWVVFNERYAQPLRVGRYGPGSSEQERRVLRDAVFNLGSDAAAVISESTVIELIEQQGKAASADLYERLADYCDRSISKAVLGQTLTTDQSHGTYATARVHQTVRRDILEADATALERTITMQLIRPLVEFNFGPDAALPAFRLLHEEGEDLASLAATYKTLSEMGFSIPASHISERFGIPALEGGI